MEMIIIVGIFVTGLFLLFLWDHRKQPNQTQEN